MYVSWEKNVTENFVKQIFFIQCHIKVCNKKQEHDQCWAKNRTKGTKHTIM